MKSKIITLNKTKTYTIDNPIPNGIDILEKISSEEGMFLTQSTDVDIRDRIICKEVMLGKGCSLSDWKEITEEEAEALKAEQKKVCEEEIKSNINKEF